jgi:hypothetical protein
MHRANVGLSPLGVNVASLTSADEVLNAEYRALESKQRDLN